MQHVDSIASFLLFFCVFASYADLAKYWILSLRSKHCAAPRMETYSLFTFRRDRCTTAMETCGITRCYRLTGDADQNYTKGKARLGGGARGGGQGVVVQSLGPHWIDILFLLKLQAAYACAAHHNSAF